MSVSEPRTSGTLLRRAQNTQDQAAWSELFDRYQPMLLRWTRAQMGNRIDAEEVSQRIWTELIRRIPALSYDPKRSFRAWLRSLHRSRLLDYIKQHRRYENHLVQLADQASEAKFPALNRELTSSTLSPTLPGSDATEACIERLLAIQQRVQARVSKQTWELFYQVTLENQSIGDVARKHSMRYASVFAAVSRVHKMLKQEAAQ